MTERAENDDVVDEPEGNDLERRPMLGIACSGGGIRSACFSLGALSHLWVSGVLQRADYISGVSGGNYAE